MERNEPIPVWRGLFWTVVIFGSVAAGLIFKIAPLLASAFQLELGC